MKTLIKLAISVLCIAALNGANAADEPSDMPSGMHGVAPTKEQREQMAKMHEHMAACLRSDKSMRECHEAARKECHDTMGDRCGMMMNSMMEHRMNKQRENGTAADSPKQ